MSTPTNTPRKAKAKKPTEPTTKPTTKKQPAKRSKPKPPPVVSVAIPTPPPPSDGWPVAPAHFKSSGQSQWEKGAALWARGELTIQDIEAWTMLCESFDELDHCYGVLEKHGEYQVSSQGGYQEHPALRRIRAVEGKILRYQKLFGLVPHSRKKRPAVQQGVATRKRS